MTTKKAAAKPAAKKPTAKKPAAKKPAVKKEAEKKPTAKKPAKAAVKTKNSDDLVTGKKQKPGTFKPGQSGNPSGRPKIPEEVITACRTKSLEAIQVLANIMSDSSAKDSDRIRAAEAILDRAWGKPYQAVQIEDSSAHEIKISWESEDYGA